MTARRAAAAALPSSVIMAAVEAVVSIPGVVSKINSEAEATSPPVPLVASVPGSATSPAAAAPAQGAFDYAGSVLRHPQLTDEEKHALIWVLAQSPAFSGLIAAADFGGADSMPDWQRCTGLLGISISRQDPVPPERTYRMRGVAEVPLSAEVSSCYCLCFSPHMCALSRQSINQRHLILSTHYSCPEARVA